MIRPARLSDRQALKELAERAHGGPSVERRTLGLPGPRPGVSRLSLSGLIPSWMPLRQASLHLVLEDRGRLVGSCRAVEEPHGGDWVVVELDAVPQPMATEIRYELLAALVEEGRNRNVSRYHAACAEVADNLELFGQLDFVAYAAEEILYRPARSQADGAAPDGALPDGEAPIGTAPSAGADNGRARDAQGLRRADSSDAWHLFHLWSRVTPPAVARTEGYSAADWEVAERDASVPRSSLTALLRPTDVRAWLLPDGLGAAAFVQAGAARHGPHYLRLVVDDATDPTSVLQAALAAAGGARPSTQWLTPVRTYEPGVRGALLVAGFAPIGTVNLLVRDVRARIAQPALVPAIQ